MTPHPALMRPFPMNKQDVEHMAEEILAAMKVAPPIGVADTETVRQCVRRVVAENLAQEKEIEAEAERLVRGLGRAVIDADADFQKLVRESKRLLARKKGFPL